MAEKTYLERMTRELADNGKLIEAGWLYLRIASDLEDAPEIQVEEMRKAFFAGAQHLFVSIMTILEPGADPTDKDIKRIDLIDKELRAFIVDLEVRNMPPEGNA